MRKTDSISTYISDRVKQFSHGFPSFELGFLHGLEFDEDCVNLGHDAANGMFHSVHSAAKTETQVKAGLLLTNLPKRTRFGKFDIWAEVFLLTTLATTIGNNLYDMLGKIEKISNGQPWKTFNDANHKT